MAQHQAPTVETEAATEPRAPGTCSVCPHPWTDHDALGVRFCTATMASAAARGCICGPAPAARRTR